MMHFKIQRGMQWSTVEDTQTCQAFPPEETEGENLTAKHRKDKLKGVQFIETWLEEGVLISSLFPEPREFCSHHKLPPQHDRTDKCILGRTEPAFAGYPIRTQSCVLTEV